MQLYRATYASSREIRDLIESPAETGLIPPSQSDGFSHQILATKKAMSNPKGPTKASNKGKDTGERDIPG